MKKIALTLGLVVLALAGACVYDDSPILLQNFRTFEDDNCTPVGQDGLKATRGRLDLAGTTSYVKWLEIASQLQPTVQPGGTTGEQVQTTIPNQAIVDTVALSYSSDPDLGIEDVSYPVTFSIDPATTDEPNLLLVELFPGPAGEALSNAVAVDETVTVNVSVRLMGRLRSGQAFTTNAVTYPVEVTRSPITCASGEVVARNGICGGPGGQDSTPVLCCPASNPLCADSTDGSTNLPDGGP